MNTFGVLPDARGATFRLLTAGRRAASLVLHSGTARGRYVMPPPCEGVSELWIEGAAAGDRYGYRLDSGPPRPDPASRFQPEGVHGPSQIVDPAAFSWSDRAWRGPSLCDLIVYELHVGTFTTQGSFIGVRDRLEHLRDLGVTAVELMPVADFAGSRSWGYDGVALYAPSRAYGTPDALRALVDRAHALGLAVILDVVYNHLGPEGAYLPEFNPGHLTDRHTTPWGRAVNLDGPDADLVRRFLIDNAVHWIREYHVDGLRLDATHALVDGGPVHFVRELAEQVRSAHRPVFVHAEDHRNLTAIVSSAGDGWALDGIWADDFHHAVRTLVCGDSHGYYADFSGTTGELARTLRQGWLYTGEHSHHLDMARGSDPSGVPMFRFVVCAQNHDQIGNRAFGERLHHQVDAATWRAVSTILLTAPMTPLLFMGQEWAASTPFQFFTDLEPALGPLVTAGRRREFRDFPAFQLEEARQRIPDPQAESTFAASRLRWEERAEPRHAAVLALYRALLRLRRSTPALSGSTALTGEAVAPDDRSLVVRRAWGPETWWIVAGLRDAAEVTLRGVAVSPDARARWELVLTTEDARFAADPVPAVVDLASGPAVRFERPGAVILRSALTGASGGGREPMPA
ncbi:MAG TPA: malto-oligosyltrehalose trehalohydrolase [Vicinamibacterales bacterium]|nr:malto-oligosyltrehalose trehalohydrolase [Vicinamibacterales bacterium]